MSKELIVNSSLQETRLAILEDDQLVEVYIEQQAQHVLAGSIYKGRVTRVLPGMQSAFVDIGLDRDAFLYVSDFFEENEDYERVPAGDRSGEEPPEVEAEAAKTSDQEEQADTGVAPPKRERRDRRRRSKRRRGKRPGFAESKYASINDAPQKGAESEVEEAPKGKEASETEFTVLPGESLAKYGDRSDEGAARSEDDSEPAPVGKAARPQESPPAISTETQPGVGSDGKEDQTASDEATQDENVIAASSREPTSQNPETGLTSPSPLRSQEPEQHPTPALPEPENESEDEDSANKQSHEDDVAGEATLAGDSEKSDKDPAKAPESGREEKDRDQVRLRRRSGSARYLRRRGRRGRRRGGSERSAAEAEASPEGASESVATEDGSGRKITDLLAKGQEILVQIAKEPLGRKGARITSHIALPGRFLVYMPTVEHVGVSRKVASDKERARLRKIVQTHRTGMPGGFIVRTAGEGVGEEDIRGDMLFLYNLWLDIKEKSDRTPAPALIHHDDDVVERVLRDRIGEEFKTVWVDNEEEYERVLRFVERFQPDLLRAVKLFTRHRPIFDEFNISGDLEKALRPKVWLKSGGYIVISPTEALVAIDVNTGKYVGKSDRLEDTIVNTNLEAAKEIVRQLRIRDLGGIIVVDFIDMEDRSNRQKVLAALEKELRRDIAPSKVLPFNEFGLAAITRKRVKQSLDRSLCTPCPYCHGASYIKSVSTVIQEIFTEAKKMAATKEPKKDMTLRVNREVARRFKSKDNTYLQDLEHILRAHVLVRSDVSLHREHFDIH